MKRMRSKEFCVRPISTESNPTRLTFTKGACKVAPIFAPRHDFCSFWLYYAQIFEPTIPTYRRAPKACAKYFAILKFGPQAKDFFEKCLLLEKQ